MDGLVSDRAQLEFCKKVKNTFCHLSIDDMQADYVKVKVNYLLNDSGTYSNTWLL